MNHVASMIEYACEGVRGLRPYEPGKPLSELEREYGIRDAVKLASNENPLGPSPMALAAALAAVPHMARYPDGAGFELRQALAKHHGVDPVSVTLGNGSNDVLDMVARVFLGPGRNAVFSRHAFAVYPIATQAVGAEARIAPALPPDHAMAYGHDLEALAGMVNDQTRVVFVANPNNPTGTWIGAGDLEGFIKALPRHTIVVVDEAYFEYVQEPDFPDASRWLERYPRLIVTRTFSKVHGLAGLRVGYGLSHPEVADLLNRVRSPFNVNGPAQAAALAALQDGEHLRRSVRMNNQGMQQLRSALAEMGLPVLPSVGNFLCVDVGRPGAEVYERLLRRGVIVRPVGGYELPNFLRVTVGSEKENQRFLTALEQALQE